MIGHGWRLWASLEAAGIKARQLPPAQVKAFGRSRGTLAKTDRVDAELIARFMAFRPEAGRRLPSEKLLDIRVLTTKRKQFVEMRKSARQQAAALTGLAPITRDSGQMRRKRMIGGGRRALRQDLYQAALVASIHNKDLKLFADQLRKKGKPHKLVVIANALCKSRQPWTPQTG